MNQRISREEFLMECARAAAKRTDCLRAVHGVGAVIARQARIVSTGYAGPTAGSIPCSSSVCDLSEPCTRTIHAEMNAIAFAARHGIAVDGCDLYCTVAPCYNCAKVIVNAGIVRVIYDQPYRDVSGIQMFQGSDIEVVNFHERYGQR